MGKRRPFRQRLEFVVVRIRPAIDWSREVSTMQRGAPACGIGMEDAGEENVGGDRTVGKPSPVHDLEHQIAYIDMLG